MRSSIIHLLVSSLLCSILQEPAHAIKQSYIVYLGAHSHGLDPLATDLQSATNSHYNLLVAHIGSHEKAKEAIFYSYNRHINGFAAVLEEEEAAEIAKNPNVVSVFLNKGHELHTTRTWEFLGLERNGIVPTHSVWNKGRYGEDTIIANLDTGVWPESKSFSGEGMGPIPSKWRGICQFEDFHCNRKLIGARFFSKGYEASFGKLNESFYTARDYNGHGTFTLSTAGGNFVQGASVFGHGNGTAKGGSPRARVAAYKVCWPLVNLLQCTDADVMAAFDAAISDGVDIISFSLGKAVTTLFEDGFSIGAFHAISNGILVVSAGGNSGPKPGTVINVAPWMFTAGASTIDRDFASYVALGNKKHLKGASVSTGLPSEKFYPLISAVDVKAANVTIEDAQVCKNGSLDPKKVKGKILVCLLNITAIAHVGQEASLAGAVGMVLVDNDQQYHFGIMPYPHILPTSHINSADGEYVYSYIKSTKTPMAYMTRAKTELGIKPAPVMASFSSRGPNIILPSILKPDIIAPGVDIIAAYSEATSPTGLISDKRRIPFMVGSGTSASTPHVAGIAALLKTVYPHWSPAAIKSAIMTTATTVDASNRPILNSSKQEPATPFAYGAGHIEPHLAMDPGLVYDLNTADYLNFLCAHGYNRTQILLFSKRPHTCPKSYHAADFNYPSITVPNLGKHTVNVTRIVTNVGSPNTYNVHVKAPKGVSVLVEPSSLTFKKVGEKKKFNVVLKGIGLSKSAGYVFGELCWYDGRHSVKSPITVKG
ncbi:hypothetical protein L6164_029554 [Bauhinia variegata]|uniref:Uncharacterized protein n=1 Tax=Bauhinia variegata TaxID=167791 RepID=A0ACB9LAH3_BAUVA|nr:hypothetical protein L6164_029554 [Bauhinia variegata]